MRVGEDIFLAAAIGGPHNPDGGPEVSEAEILDGNWYKVDRTAARGNILTYSISTTLCLTRSTFGMRIVSTPF